MKSKMRKIKFSKALLKDQWQDDVTFTLDDQGLITDITPQDHTLSPSTEVISGYAIPGMPNIHSHAFQRAMAGLAEYATSDNDSFWTWRDVMYRFSQILTPDDLYHIARQLYLEMLMSGYTSVAEFHYLHHQPGGNPYDNPAEMSLALARAARELGINLIHLPVLYMTAGFGGIPLSDEQARFGHSPDSYCALLDLLHKNISHDPTQRLGIAFHSLRAVPPDAFDPVIRHLNKLDPAAPIHIHIAEQEKEVKDCTNWSGQRPVEWLLNHQDMNNRWCLVHATHLNEAEIIALAKSGAVAGLCPTTEANLGDGLFPLKTYLDQGGHIAIGSDSHISISPVEELRLLEYGQRLKYRRRNMVASSTQNHTGMALCLNALKGGARASGIKDNTLAPGNRADILVLDPVIPTLVGTPDKYIMDRLIFSGNVNPIKDVMVSGHWQVKDKTHILAPEINRHFQQTMEKLANIID